MCDHKLLVIRVAQATQVVQKNNEKVAEAPKAEVEIVGDYFDIDNLSESTESIATQTTEN